MSEGLNIDIIKFNKLGKDNNIFRLDAEFFSKECECLNNVIKQRPHFYLREDDVVSGPFGSSLRSDSYLEKGVPFIRIENIKGGFFINKQELIYISEKDNERLSNSQLRTNDIILSKVGNSIGYFARVDETLKKCNISENNIGIKMGRFTDVSKHYILTYLNTEIANKLVLRRRSGNAQPKLNVNDLTFIPIPLIDNYIQTYISNLVIKSALLAENSIARYNECIEELLSIVRLDKDIASNSIGYLSTFATTSNYGRLDAEYYNPQYEYLFNQLKQFETVKLGDVVVMQKSIEPGSDYYLTEGVPFVRVADLTKFGVTEPSIYLDKEIFKDVIRPKQDTILMSKDGSIGIAYKVEKDEDFITSGAILHLQITNDIILPDYLTLVINSKVVQMQAERDAGGSIIQHWKPSEISNVVIPILPMEKQQEISQKVQESFRLRNESKRLLNVAKTAVEIAISESEEAALEYLKENENG